MRRLPRTAVWDVDDVRAWLIDQLGHPAGAGDDRPPALPARDDLVRPARASHRSRRPGKARDYLWAWITTATHPDEHRWLLIRRNRTTGELAFYLCWSPRPVPLHTLEN
ncbi:hypothetical protein ACQP08_21860 [Micromonospora zamorensis]|uniref:hypothetical protein n=1 Tax=Micromonospora zamorensis TaxID=709883 RepID=UPI003D8EB3F6